MTTPFVSVLIDTFNHEHLIEDAVNSVFDQDFLRSEYEILVVDDGSTDRTRHTLRKFEPRLRVLEKPNGGQASAFNYAIPQCRGEIIAFLDGDDWWAPTKLSRVAERMSLDREVAIVGHGIKESYADGSEIIVVPKRRERLRLDSLAAATIFRLRKCFLGTSRMTIRAGIARQIIPIPETLVIQADEYFFTLATALNYLEILDEPLTYYRIHAGNLYFSSGRGKPGLERKQRCLAALCKALRSDLAQRAVPEDVTNCVVEIVQAEADQLRLRLDGGLPWETFRIESKLFEVMHGDASLPARLFRLASMSLALVLPPKWFYAGRNWLGSRSWYRSMRQNTLQVPEMTKATDWEKTKA